MVRLLVALALAAGAWVPGAAAAPPPHLPPVAFQDQDGRVLDLARGLGRVAVFVYGDRTAIDQHIAWGRRLDADLRARGAYRAGDPPEARPVWILAIAQMGGIPGAFRDALRALIRPRVEAGHSLWLDWDNVLSTRFGERRGESTVVVADRDGVVRLVVAGPPEGEPFRAVTEILRRLE